MTDRIVDPGNLGSGRAVLRPGAKARKLPARELRSSSVPPADRRFHLLVGLDNALAIPTASPYRTVASSLSMSVA